ADITLQRVTLKKRSAHARGGRMISRGKIAHPVGTVTRKSVGGKAPERSASQYSRHDELAAAGTQYSITLVNNSSLVKRRSTSPSQSLQARNFSTIHAARPAGE